MSFSAPDVLSLAGLSSGSLSAVNPSDIPAAVRNGNSAAKSAYAEGLEFEQVLVNQLAQQLTSASSPDASSDTSDDGSTDGSADDTDSGSLLGGAAGPYSSLTTQALTSAVMSSGGLGIAQEVAEAIDPAMADASSPTGGSIMSAVVSESAIDGILTGDLLAHLEQQLESARRLLAIVLEQGVAIRQRDVQNVVRLAGALQVEMHRREGLENQRLELLQRAATKLQIGPGDVSLSLLEALMDDGSAVVARGRSAELRGRLAEIQREHHVNRALMQQELRFLDHLLRLAGSPGGYDAGGERATARRANPMTRRRMFDVEA